MGVEVIFIPTYTPEANPVVESFNDVWDTNFWSRTIFYDLPHVQSELTFFEHYCRHRRPLPKFDNMTADQIAPNFVPVHLPPAFDQHQQGRMSITAGRVHGKAKPRPKGRGLALGVQGGGSAPARGWGESPILGIELGAEGAGAKLRRTGDGRVYFIRFVSSAGTFSMLNERWQLDKEKWAGKTIRATVDTEAQQLYVYHQPKESKICQLVAQFDYPLGEQVTPLANESQRERPAFWPPVEQYGC